MAPVLAVRTLLAPIPSSATVITIVIGRGISSEQVGFVAAALLD